MYSVDGLENCFSKAGLRFQNTLLQRLRDTFGWYFVSHSEARRDDKLSKTGERDGQQGSSRLQPAAGSLLESSPFVKLWICDPLSECETLHQRSELSATFSRLLSPFFARNYNLNSIPGCECLEKLAHLACSKQKTKIILSNWQLFPITWL